MFPDQQQQLHRILLDDDDDDDAKSTWFRVIFTGYFHTIPGLVMIFGGSIYLLVTLVRARRLQPGGPSFCDLHVPEKNYKFLKVLSRVIVTLIILMMIRQVSFDCLLSDEHTTIDCFMIQMGHVEMYLLYACTGVVVLLECTGRVPMDSWRCSAVLCFLLNYMLLVGHAESKTMKTNKLTHELWALIEFIHAIIMSYSIYNTSNIMAYVASWTMFILKGSWIITAGVQIDSDVMSLENIRPMFILQTIVIALSVTFIGAFFGNIHYKYDNNNNNTTTDAKEYEQLKGLPYHDDDDNTHLGGDMTM